MPVNSSVRSGEAARRRRTWRRFIPAAIFVILGGVAYWQTHKSLPDGVRLAGAWVSVPTRDIHFIADITAADAYGRPVVSQAIFDETLRIVRAARHFLVIDYFLFNDHHLGTPQPDLPMRALSHELRDALIEQRTAYPQLRVLLITDPINEIYGGAPSSDLKLLRAAGVDVVTTNLDVLRDSNFIYSSLWRLLLGWWSGSGEGSGWLPNPLATEPPKVTFRALARLANFKANHRKVIIADDGESGIVGLVTSANPHDASSAHSNVAVRVSGAVLEPLLDSELDIARFSGWKEKWSASELVSQVTATADARSEQPPTTPPRIGPPAAEVPTRSAEISSDGTVARARFLTEGAIRDALLEQIGGAVEGDSIDVAMFYIADRSTVEALLAAEERGVAVRLILDPNKDAFGRTKSGIPNRPVASELVASSDGNIRIRWYRTHGEQFHTKMVMVYGPDRTWITLGSANLTRRNIGDYNLEANIAIEVARGSELALQTLNYFDTLWHNRASLGIEYTADFGVYADPAQSRYWLYRLMEGAGLSTF